MANRPAVYPNIRRNADGSVQRNYANSDFQRLMWKVFFYDRTYAKNDLAASLGVAADTVHAYANGDLRLHVDTVRRIIAFVAEQNPKDRRFMNYFLPDGFIAIPAQTCSSLNKVVDLSIDLIKKVKAASKDRLVRDEKGGENHG